MRFDWDFRPSISFFRLFLTGLLSFACTVVDAQDTSTPSNSQYDGEDPPIYNPGSVLGTESRSEPSADKRLGAITLMPDGRLEFRLRALDGHSIDQAALDQADVTSLEATSRGGLGDFGSFTNTPFDRSTWKKTAKDVERRVGGFTGYRTNKFELREKVQQGGWIVAWGNDISETDLINGAVAAGVSVYSGNPIAFKAWVNQLVWETFYSLKKSLGKDVPPAVAQHAQQYAQQVLIDVIRRRSLRASMRRFDTVDFKAGMIQYEGGNYLGGRKVSPTGGFKPYVAFRWRGSADGGNAGRGGQGGSTSYRVELINPYRYAIHYSLNRKKFTVLANKTAWHKRTNAAFNIRFDASFRPGDQPKSYRLRPNSRNVFVQTGNSLDLQYKN